MIIEIPDRVMPREVIVCVLDERPDNKGQVPYMAWWYDDIRPALFGQTPVQGQIFYGDVHEAIRRLRGDGRAVSLRRPVAPYAPVERDSVQHHPMCSRSEHCGGRCLESQEPAATGGNPR